jgi:hypothetical protein
MGTLVDRRQYGALVHSVITYKGTYDLASLADGVGTTATFTVTGVQAPGTAPSRVSVSLGVDLQGITVTGYVSAANTVAVRFQNESGGTLDLASTTIYIVVEEYSTRAFV